MTDANPDVAPPVRTRGWAERHATKVGVALLVVPLVIRSLLITAGVSDDVADATQLVVGGASLAGFIVILVRSRRQSAGT